MFTTLKKLNIILEPGQKRKIIGLFVITVISAFLEMLGVTLMIPMITAIMTPDIIESNKYIAWVCNLLDLHSHRTFVIACIGALILIFIFKDVFLIFQYYAQTRFICNSRFETQQRILKAFLCKPYEFFLNASSADIMRVVQSDTVQVYTMLAALLSMASELIVSVVLVITIFIIDPLMTAFVAVMMFVILLIIAKIVRPILRREGIKFQKNGSETNKWILQAVAGIKEVKVSQKEMYFLKKYQKYGEKYIHSEKINTTIQNIPRLLIEMVSICSMLALIALEIIWEREIESLVPTLGAFAMAAVKLMPSANRIIGAVNSVAFNSPALDKVIEQLSECVHLELLENEHHDEIDLKIDEKVSLNGISYHYPNSERTVLDDVSMSIPVGKSVGIVGPSGAGKTTVVDIMLGLLTPQLGSVLVDEVNIMNDYPGWLSHIGYISQMIFMLDESIRSNVAFGVNPEDIDDNQVWHCLEEAQLADFVKELPEGLDTLIGERGVRISGGQRQRIGIARALYENPDLLLFDEATSALDNDTETAIIESINALHGKKTMVIIAHRLQTIKGCDIVYKVQDGKIVKER